VLREIFGPKRDGVTGVVESSTKRGSLCPVLLIKYYSGDQIKKNEIGGERGTYKDREGAYRGLMGKPE